MPPAGHAGRGSSILARGAFLDTTILYYPVIGLAAGLLGGLLGVGGGLVVVPALVLLFQIQGWDAALAMRTAVGTSLATVVITAVTATYAQHRRGAVLWPVVRQIAPGLVAGALGGAVLVLKLPGNVLKLGFGLFALFVALQLLSGRQPAPDRSLPTGALLHGAGVFIGLLSALLGIGGGTLCVPFFVRNNVPLRSAIATSSACGLPIALTGALVLAAAGTGGQTGVLGHVHLVAFAGIALGSVATASWGARLVHVLPMVVLRGLFCLYLVLMGVRMIYIGLGL